MKYVAALVATAAFALQPLPAAAAGGPSNVVMAMNRTDGRLAIQSNLQLVREPGMVAAPLNFAMANASCTDCQTIAVALQLNFASTDAHLIAPQNVAVASNAGCTRCVTVAIATQFFYTVDDPTRLPDGAAAAMRDLDATLRDISTDPNITLADALTRIDAVVREFMATATLYDAQRSTGGAQ